MDGYVREGAKELLLVKTNAEWVPDIVERTESALPYDVPDIWCFEKEVLIEAADQWRTETLP